jgi:hypothetical protein
VHQQTYTSRSDPGYATECDTQNGEGPRLALVGSGSAPMQPINHDYGGYGTDSDSQDY